MTTYLDWNATTPRHPAVVRAMQAAEEEAWANPSSTHRMGRGARRYVEEARETLAHVFGVSPRDVVFTGSGTEANHLALSGAECLLTSRLEHPSIVKEAEWMQTQGCDVRWVPVTPAGVVEPDAVALALDSVARAPQKKAPLVALSAVNHETGVLQPIGQIAHVAHERGARLHVDAVQLLGRSDLAHLEGFDSASVAAHKVRGPKGVGALLYQCGWTPTPRARGGAQERGLRPGTMDAMAMAGFAEALRRLDESQANYGRAARLGEALREALLTRSQERAHLHGGGASLLGHVVNFRVDGWRGDELIAALDLEGICVSSGSACSAGTAEPSPVIEVMLGREAAIGAVRVSFGEESTEVDAEHLLSSLQKLGVLRSA